ncbi:MAG: SRPBCC family protein [Candidatus Acidiferrales bacterium]
MATPKKESESRLEIRRTFAAPREKVFAAWTERGRLEKWMCKDVPEHNPSYTELDLRPGGRYVIEIPMPKEGFTYRGYGVFREVRPPEKLVFTWAWEKIFPGRSEPEDLHQGESQVTVELIARGKSTEMIFTHEGFPSAKIRDEHQKGWDGCFDALDKALAA